MCNLKRHYKLWDEYVKAMAEEAIRLPPAQQELPFCAEIRPSELAPVLTVADGEPRLDLLEWGWLKPGTKARIINVQAEKRRDPPGVRGLTLLDAFYEFKGDKAPKSKFEFTPATNERLAFGVFRRGNTYALGTVAPGPDVAPIHNRQPLIIPQSAWKRWLLEHEWPTELVQPLPGGSLRVQQVR